MVGAAFKLLKTSLGRRAGVKKKSVLDKCRLPLPYPFQITIGVD